MKNKPFIRNLIAVFGITVSIAVIVLSVLQIFGVWQDALYLTIPLLVLINWALHTVNGNITERSHGSAFAPRQ